MTIKSVKISLVVITGTVGGVQQSVRNVSRERWGDIYCNMPVKRMIALYDYDPQELSPNVDAEVCAKLNFIFCKKKQNETKIFFFNSQIGFSTTSSNGYHYCLLFIKRATSNPTK